MTARRVLVLLAIAVLVIAGGILLGSRNRADDSAPAGAVLTGLKATVNDITEVRLSKGDARATLKKGPDGWIVAEREYPADAGRVRKLLLDLAELSVVEEKTSNPELYSQLGVEDVGAKSTGTLVEIVGPKETTKLIVGKPSGTKSSYVRVAGKAPSALASPQLTLEAEPRRWLDRELLDVQQNRVKEIDVKPASGPAYTVTREKAEQTDFTVPRLPKGAKLSSPGAPNAGASALAGLTLDDVRRSTKPDEKAAVDAATFRTFDGLEIDLTGRKEGERRYVSVSARSTAKETAEQAQEIEARAKGWDFEIPSYKYDSIFRPLSELLEQK